MSLPVLFCAIVLFAVPWGTICAPADPGDAAAMQAIARSVGAANSSLGWGSKDPCDGTWAGVSCNEAGRVTSIVVRGAGLAGYITGSDLGNLSFLSNLDVSSDSLISKLPAVPTPLQHLRAINVSSNSFWDFPDNFFAAFPALETFVLDNNAMKTPSFDKDDVITCSNLRIFSANDARIEDIFPNFFGNVTLFPALETLSLARNRIDGSIHAGFGDFSKIKYLDVGGQRSPSGMLVGRIDLFIPGLRNLVEVRLDHNGFYGPLPDTTAHADLRLFDASYNDLCGLPKFPRGTEFNIAGNPKVGEQCYQ